MSNNLPDTLSTQSHDFPLPDPPAPLSRRKQAVLLIRSFATFYFSGIKSVFSGSWQWMANVSTLLGLIWYLIQDKVKPVGWEARMASLLWQIPLFAGLAFIAGKFLFYLPFQKYQELKNQSEEAERTLRTRNTDLDSAWRRNQRPTIMYSELRGVGKLFQVDSFRQALLEEHQDAVTAVLNGWRSDIKNRTELEVPPLPEYPQSPEYPKYSKFDQRWRQFDQQLKQWIADRLNELTELFPASPTHHK